VVPLLGAGDVFNFQFNVVSLEAFRKAQKHIEEYYKLMLRMLCDSASFLEKDIGVQNDIIAA
jgi:pyruvate-formate lyase